MRTDEIRPMEIRPVEIRPVEIRPVEIRPVEIRPVDIRPVKTKQQEIDSDLLTIALDNNSNINFHRRYEATAISHRRPGQL